jgi:hypothetical protein
MHVTSGGYFQAFVACALAFAVRRQLAKSSRWWWWLSTRGRDQVGLIRMEMTS